MTTAAAGPPSRVLSVTDMTHAAATPMTDDPAPLPVVAALVVVGAVIALAIGALFVLRSVL